MLKFLRSVFGGLFGGLFNIFYRMSEAVMRTPGALLDLFGMLPTPPQQQAAYEAEEAAAQAQMQHFGSSLDKRATVLTPEAKATALVNWIDWKTGVVTGKEPSLDGFSAREKIKLKAANEQTLQALTLRTMPVIEQWLNSPKKALEPLSPAQLTPLEKQMSQFEREGAEMRAKWQATADRAEARHTAMVSSRNETADEAIAEVEAALSYRPSFA